MKNIPQSLSTAELRKWEKDLEKPSCTLDALALHGVQAELSTRPNYEDNPIQRQLDRMEHQRKELQTENTRLAGSLSEANSVIEEVKDAVANA